MFLPLFLIKKRCSSAFLTLFALLYLATIALSQDTFRQDFNNGNSANVTFVGGYDNSKNWIEGGSLKVWQWKHNEEHTSIAVGAINIKDFPFLNFRICNDSSVKIPYFITVGLEDSSGNIIRRERRKIAVSDTFLVQSFSFLNEIKKEGFAANKVKAIKIYINPRYDFHGTLIIDDISLGRNAKALPYAYPLGPQNLYIDAKPQKFKMKYIEDGLDGRKRLRIKAKSLDASIVKVVDYAYLPASNEVELLVQTQSSTGATFIDVILANESDSSKIRVPILVEKNKAPELADISPIEMKTGSPKSIPLDISDGNISVEQAVQVTVISVDARLLSATYDKKNQLLMLKSNNGTGVASLKLLLVDDGGTNGGGIDSKEYILKVNITSEINNSPAIGPIEEVIAFANSGRKTFHINQVNDGDKNAVPLSFKFAVKDPNIVKISSYEYDAASQRLSVSYEPLTLGSTIVVITVTEGEEGSSKATEAEILFNVRPLPRTGWVQQFSDRNDLSLLREEWYHKVKLTKGLLVVSTKPNTFPEIHGGVWLKLPRLDISKSPRISIKAKTDRSMLTAVDPPPTEKSREDVRFVPLLIYLVDSKGRYNVTTPADLVYVSPNNSTINVNEYEEYYFNFESNLLFDGNRGEEVDLTQIDSILINIRPGKPSDVSMLISEIRIGDSAHIKPGIVPIIKLKSFSDKIAFIENGMCSIGLPKADMLKDSIAYSRIKYSLITSNSNIVSNTQLDASGSATLNLSFLPISLGNITFSVIASLDGYKSDTSSFDVNVSNMKNLEVASIKVDTSKKFQTFDGFGVTNLGNSFIDIATDDLGLSIVRIGLNPLFEQVNDNSNPNVINRSGFDVSKLNYVKELKRLKDKNVKIIGSIWSPPAWMKKNLSPAVPTNALSTDEGSENAVDPDYYEELAEFVVSYINAIKRETGVEMYAVSLQNEPNFDKRYESCKYTPNELKQLTSIVKARFQRENLTTKIFGPETIPDNPETNDYRNATLKDLDYFGLHLYSNDGFNEATISPSKWSQIHSLMHSQREDIGIWITETSGEPATEEGAIHLANKMATALTYGNVQAYCYWTFFARSSDEKFGLYSPANKFLKKYYAFKNYSAFIKPGAVRVEASSPSRDLLVTAFVNTDSTIALVVVNNGEQDFRLDLDMQLIENKTGFSAYRTARGLDCLRLENPTEQLTIARRSITTYVSKLSGPEKPPVVAGTDFKVFPVPANEVINVTIPLNRYDNVRIIDVLGRIVRESVVPEGKEDLTFLIDNLDMGIYIVEATGENLRSRKMILVR